MCAASQPWCPNRSRRSRTPAAQTVTAAAKNALSRSGARHPGCNPAPLRRPANRSTTRRRTRPHPPPGCPPLLRSVVGASRSLPGLRGVACGARRAPWAGVPSRKEGAEASGPAAAAGDSGGRAEGTASGKGANKEKAPFWAANQKKMAPSLGGMGSEWWSGARGASLWRAEGADSSPEPRGHGCEGEREPPSAQGSEVQ